MRDEGSQQGWQAAFGCSADRLHQEMLRRQRSQQRWQAAFRCRKGQLCEEVPSRRFIWSASLCSLQIQPENSEAMPGQLPVHACTRATFHAEQIEAIRTGTLI